jgi:GNAT superfamily N-acetyltransferase
MVQAPQFRVEARASEHAPALAQLLSGNGFGCYCRYWHFAGNHREWLARCAHEPELNRDELLAACDTGSSEAAGMVALNARDEVIGWLKLAPATLMAKLYDQRLYKGLPCLNRPADGVWTVGCLFVREDQRRRGVAKALLAAAVVTARGAGAQAIEAFPRSDVDVADAALMMGPLALFVQAGFEVIHDFAPYPVLRKRLLAEHGEATPSAIS